MFKKFHQCLPTDKLNWQSKKFAVSCCIDFKQARFTALHLSSFPFNDHIVHFMHNYLYGMSSANSNLLLGRLCNCDSIVTNSLTGGNLDLMFILLLTYGLFLFIIIKLLNPCKYLRLKIPLLEPFHQNHLGK